MVYELTVENDGSPEQQKKSARKFTSKDNELKAKGLGEDAIMELFESLMLSEESKNEFKAMKASLAFKSQKEVTDLLVKKLSSTQAQGASWNGSAGTIMLYIGAILLLSVSLALAGPVEGGCYDDCYYVPYCDYDYWGDPIFCGEDYVCDVVCY